MPSPTPGGGSPRTPRQPGKPIVDQVFPNPGKNRARARIKPTPVPGKGRGARPLPIDERIVRTMPITEKQLGQIKKMYGV